MNKIWLVTVSCVFEGATMPTNVTLPYSVEEHAQAAVSIVCGWLSETIAGVMPLAISHTGGVFYVRPCDVRAVGIQEQQQQKQSSLMMPQ